MSKRGAYAEKLMDWRDPDNALAKMLTDYDFASGRLLPKDTVIEVEVRTNPEKLRLSDIGAKRALSFRSILWTMKLLKVQSHRGYFMIKIDWQKMRYYFAKIDPPINIETLLASDEKEAWRLKGYANGCAFACYMFAENPELTEGERKAYKWAEKEFNKIAGSKVTVDEAVCGYGG
jgi:hypothetical protein